MSARTHSGSGLVGFVLGVVATIIVAAGLVMWSQGAGREAPIRTAELSIPTPELPAPPGTIPQTNNSAPAQ